jgi:hypothetical protein
MNKSATPLIKNIICLQFHLGGKLVITPPDIFKRLVDNVLPIIKAKGAKPAVIIPPPCQDTFSLGAAVTQSTAAMRVKRIS